MRPLLILLFCYLAVTESQSQLQLVRAFTTTDGLSHNEVNKVYEDQYGFLWLGTKEGLNRFDGLHFKNYFSERNNFQSLSHNYINDILEYQDGMLLIATSSGLSVFNTKTGQFENDKVNFKSLQARSGIKVSSLYKDPDNHIWVNHSGQLDVFDENLNYLFRFTDLDWTKSLIGVDIIWEDWQMDKAGRLWLPSDTLGIHVIDFKVKKILNAKNNPSDFAFLHHKYIRAFLLDEVNGCIWVAPWGEGLLQYDLKTGQLLNSLFNHFDKIEERSINSIIKVENNNILFTYHGDCYELNPNSLSHISVQRPKSNGKSLSGIQFYNTDLLRTHNNLYWIASPDGLLKLDKPAFHKELNLLPTSNNGNCADLLVSKSGKLFALLSNQWLVEIDSSRKIIQSYPFPAIPKTSLNKIVEDHENRLWIASTGDIRLFDLTNKMIIPFSSLFEELDRQLISALFCDADGDIWIATRNPCGLFRYEKSTHHLIKIDETITKPFSDISENGRISTIVQEKSGRLWMVSNVGGGMLSYEKKINQWTIYPEVGRDKNILSKNGILSVWPDSEGHLWVTNWFSGGLIQYNYLLDSIVSFTREDGLLTDQIIDICADNLRNIWIMSQSGFSKFDMASKTVLDQVFTDYIELTNSDHNIKFDSLSQSIIFTDAAFLYFISVNPVDEKDAIPVPLLDAVYINNEQYVTDLSNPSLQLKPTQNNISIDFTAVTYSNADKLKFAYQFDGPDTNWIFAKDRTVHFSLLPPGKYIFNVKVSDHTGNWGSSHTLLTFTIIPPFWKTTWFLLTSIILTLSALLLVVRSRIKQIRSKAEIKQKLLETEMLAVQSQLNPHFIFNCLNSIDSLIQNNDKYHATIYLNKFAKLLRNILDTAKNNTVSIVKDMETLKLYIELEQFRNEDRFKTQIEIGPELLNSDFRVPPLIIQPFVENAILHGLRNRPDNNGMLFINLSKKSDALQYIIQDNGVGRINTFRPGHQERQSHGIEMTRQRVKLFNKEEEPSITIIDLEDHGHPTGTRVEVLLKMT